MHDVFISYSFKDKSVADAVAHTLEDNRVRCWIAPRDVIPGQSYPEAIATAIETAKLFVLIFSESSNGSRQVENELLLALTAEKTIIPVKLDEAMPRKSFRYIFGTTHWLDVFADDPRHNFKGLVKSVLILLGKQAEEHQVNCLSDSISPTANVITANLPDAQSEPTTCTTINKGVQVVPLEYLLAHGYTSLKIAGCLEANDFENYPAMTHDQEGDAIQWAEYMESFPDTFRFLVDSSDLIVGAWYILAVSNEQFETIMSGKFNERNFFVDNTEFLVYSGVYKAFILDMSINKGFRSASNIRMLTDSFLRQIEAYAQEGIFFSDFVVNVFSREGISMYRSLGFKEICKHVTFGVIYHMKFLPLPANKALAGYLKLKELYKDEYNRPESTDIG